MAEYMIHHSPPENEHELRPYYNNPLNYQKVWTSSYKPLDSASEEEDQKQRRSAMTYDPSNSSDILPPQKIGRFGGSPWTESIFSLFTVLVSVPFVWLAIVITHYSNERVSESATQFISQYTRTASTAFTIFFAAVFGVSLKRFATFRVEKGIKLGLLEQLMQSRTVFAALATQLHFRFFNVVALALIMSWAFSPLGSQASLRLISIGSQSTSQTGISEYLTTRVNVFDSASGASSLVTSLKPMYVSALLGAAPIKNGPEDLWGNVKIPFLRANATTNATGWIDMTSIAQTEEMYSSLVGVPTASLANENSTFTIASTYISLDCSKPANATQVPISLNPGPNGTFMGYNATTTSTNTSGILPFWTIGINQFVNYSMYVFATPDAYVTANYTNPVPQGTLLFQTRDFSSQCKLNQVYVESAMVCYAQAAYQSPTCTVVAQRNSILPHAPSTFTFISVPTVWEYVSRLWILSTDPLSSSGYSSLTEYYLQNTSASFMLSGNDREYANYTNVTAQQFSTRLSQLLNTFMLSSLTVGHAMGPGYGVLMDNATVTYTETYDVYIISKVWMVIYCASTAVMLIAALVGAWCNYKTTVPDLLCYCSTIVRDSKFFDTAQSGSTLNGLERAKMYRNVDVKLGDVVLKGASADYDPGAGLNRTGYLALGPRGAVSNPRRGVLYA